MSAETQLLIFGHSTPSLLILSSKVDVHPLPYPIPSSRSLNAVQTRRFPSILLSPEWSDSNQPQHTIHLSVGLSSCLFPPPLCSLSHLEGLSMWSLSLLCSVSRLLLYSPDVSNTLSLTFIRTSGLPWSIKLNETHSPGERSLACFHCDLQPLPSLEEKYALSSRKKDKGHKERSWPAEPSIDLVSPSDPQDYKNQSLAISSTFRGDLLHCKSKHTRDTWFAFFSASVYTRGWCHLVCDS